MNPQRWEPALKGFCICLSAETWQVGCSQHPLLCGMDNCSNTDTSPVLREATCFRRTRLTSQMQFLKPCTGEKTLVNLYPLFSLGLFILTWRRAPELATAFELPKSQVSASTCLRHVVAARQAAGRGCPSTALGQFLVPWVATESAGELCPMGSPAPSHVAGLVWVHPAASVRRRQVLDVFPSAEPTPAAISIARRNHRSLHHITT